MADLPAQGFFPYYEAGIGEKVEFVSLGTVDSVGQDRWQEDLNLRLGFALFYVLGSGMSQRWHFHILACGGPRESDKTLFPIESRDNLSLLLKAGSPQYGHSTLRIWRM